MYTAIRALPVAALTMSFMLADTDGTPFLIFSFNLFLSCGLFCLGRFQAAELLHVRGGMSGRLCVPMTTGEVAWTAYSPASVKLNFCQANQIKVQSHIPALTRLYLRRAPN